MKAPIHRSKSFWGLLEAGLVVIGLVASVATLPGLNIDRCLDGGGVWVASKNECVCTYESLGTFSDVPTEEQLALRTECESKPAGKDWERKP